MVMVASSWGRLANSRLVASPLSPDSRTCHGATMQQPLQGWEIASLQTTASSNGGPRIEKAKSKFLLWLSSLVTGLALARIS
jgi:hypothetical protein